jgi:tetratricopeptide (TPR) repeat protein
VKKLFGIKMAGIIATLALAVCVLGLPMQLTAQVVTAKLHGKITNAAGIPVTKGAVRFTTDKTSEPKDRKYPFSFPIDGTGNYKGEGISPGDYIAVVTVDEKNIDFQNVVLKAGDDRVLDFDMTRPEFLKLLTPEERAAIEENKKHNAGVLAENAKIGNINATLVQARADEKNGKAEEAVTALKPLTEMRPNESVIWAALGEAQLSAADAAAKAAKAAHQPTNDPAIMQKYTDTIASYQKAIELDATSKKPSPETVAACYMNMGQALAKSGKLPEAAAAYESAVKASPTSAPTAYFNEAATFFNAGKMDEAAAAADKAIAADPKRADNYYIKGQALIPKATMDAKTNKFILPPGCLEAYQEYLVLMPEGGHSAEIKDLLNNLGQPVKNSFRAGKK